MMLTSSTLAQAALALSFLSSAAFAQGDDAAAAAAEFPFPHPVRPVPPPIGCGTGEEAVECPACDAAPRECYDRVRRSWTTLTDEEKQIFIDALHTIKNTPTEEGRELYGPQFTNYNELVLQHASGTADPRGDQSHLDQHFSFFHRMYVLKFENTLLSVAPELQGVPYWDLRDGVDALFGPGPLSFGSTTGTGPNYELEDGAFADWTVASYDDHYEAGEAIPLFANHKDIIFSNVTGSLLLRSSDVTTPRLVRYPACTDEGPGPLKYQPADYQICTAESSTFEEFYWCLEAPSVNGAHEMVHFWVGSADSTEYGFGCPSFAPPNLKLVRQGDYIDKLTSPNDPIFFLHHSFVDMMSFEFMRNHPDDAAHYWGFKASAPAESKPQVEGTFLMDVIGSGWPFVGSEVLIDAETTGAPTGALTYADSMCWVGPETAIYTYDQFVTEGDICSTTTTQTTSNQQQQDIPAEDEATTPTGTEEEEEEEEEESPAQPGESQSQSTTEPIEDILGQGLQDSSSPPAASFLMASLSFLLAALSL